MVGVKMCLDFSKKSIIVQLQQFTCIKKKIASK